MRMDEATTLLQVISSLDRKPFPDGAEVAWCLVLEQVELADALEAVKRHYSQPQARPATPGDVRALAGHERDRRGREARKALPAAPARCEDRQARVREISAMLAAKLGDLDRPPSRPRPDATSPTTDVDAGEFEQARARALKLLESRSFATT